MTREQAKTVLDLMLTTAHTTLCETEKDAIRTASELLKEQEPVEPEMEGGGSNWWMVCGECHGPIVDIDRYCRHCGKKIRRKTACDGCENKGSEDCALGKPGSENAYCPNGKLR